MDRTALAIHTSNYRHFYNTSGVGATALRELNRRFVSTVTQRCLKRTRLVAQPLPGVAAIGSGPNAVR